MHWRGVLAVATVLVACGGSGTAGSQQEADETFGSTFDPVPLPTTQGGSTGGSSSPGDGATTTGATSTTTADPQGGSTSTTTEPTSSSTGAIEPDGASTGASDPSGTTAGRTATGSTGAAVETTGEAPFSSPLCEQSDEFDASDVSTWTLLSVDPPANAPQWDASRSEPGVLTVVPSGSGWYDSFQGFFLWQLVHGDFAVETSVRVTSVGDDQIAPALPYNSGGLLIRDPGSAAGTETWLTFNVGMQDGQVGFERKITEDSVSELEIDPGANAGILRMCRVGDTIVVARQLEGESAMVEIASYVMDELPRELQVGLMANGWNSLGSVPDTSVAPDVRARFDYIRFWPLRSLQDCLLPDPCQ